MAVADTSTWNPAVTFMITQAYRNLDVIQDDEEPTGAQYVNALFVLNSMVKTWQASGIHVWTEEEAILFLQPGQPKYVIGGSGATAETSPADEWSETTLAAPAIAGASTITVTSDLLIEDGMRIGVVQNDNLTFWTTVNGAPASNVVTLTDPLDGAVSDGAFVFTYTTKIVRPLLVPKARLLQYQGLIENPMTVLSRQEYMDQPNKLAPGTPTQWFYSPQRDQGLLYVWPVGNTSSWAVRFTWYRPIADYLIPSNTSDFPQEWINPLVWNLAKELAPGLSIPPARWTMVKETADAHYETVLAWDRESEPVQFGMSWEYL